MIRQLLIVAAGGLAREALVATRAQGRYEVVGLLDDNAGRWGQTIDGVRVLGGSDLLAEYPDTDLLLCPGRGSDRAAIQERLGLDDGRFATVIHPSVLIPQTCRVGAGSILLAGTVLTTSVNIGRHVVIMPNVTLTHDDIVADFATLCAGVTLGGSVRVGRAAFLGMNSCVREGVHVGPDSILGMGSVLLTDTSAAETWLGVPARPLPVTDLSGNVMGR